MEVMRWGAIDRNPIILLVGDVMLDCYTWGNTERVSPEAPVLVLSCDEENQRLGGAAGTARMLRGLGADVTLVGAVGDDANGRSTLRLLDEIGVQRGAVTVVPGRPTTRKTRFIGRAAGRHPHQILRVDRESRDELSHPTFESWSSFVREALVDCDVLAISDYDKRVCETGFLRDLIDAARKSGRPVIVDPAARTDYDRYRGASIVIPNRREASLATGSSIDDPDDAIRAAKQLAADYDLDTVIVKLDSQGMVCVSRQGESAVFPTRARAVYDVTGAGDMVLAVVSWCQSLGISISQTVRTANAAAGLEVERFGAVPVTWDEISSELQATPGAPVEKTVTLAELERLAWNYRRDRKTIVFTNGCFDLLHIGHVSYLKQAAALGDVLIVAINSDDSVRRLKGTQRPVIGAIDRAALLAELRCVDHVVVFDDLTPHETLRRVRPHVLVKGGNYTVNEVIGKEVVESYGGKVCTVAKVEGVSTTQILESVSQQRKSPLD